MTLFLPAATTVLVVDDERISRRVAYRILTEECFRVLEADSGVEAVDVLRLARGRIDLLMIDVVMPECDGVATSLNVPFLAKPYTRGPVLAKVEQALDRRHQQRVL